jgi:hypothetical protein
MLENGSTELQVEQIFLNSSEYRILHNTNTAYVDALYNDVLGRTPTSSEETFWENQLAQGGSMGVVSGIVNSLESYRDIVADDYTTYMDRSPDTAGQDYWATALQNNGGNTEQVALAFLSSDEYFALGVK